MKTSSPRFPEPLEAFLPQALSEVSPDWSSRTYGGTTTIRLSFISPTDWELRAYGVGPTFAAAARDALRDVDELRLRQKHRKLFKA